MNKQKKPKKRIHVKGCDYHLYAERGFWRKGEKMCNCGAESWNDCCEDWEAYHNQETQLLKDMLKASDDSLSLAQEKIAELEKHNCEKWFKEAIGCSICKNIILKSPVKNMDKMKELITFSNAKINALQQELARIKGISVDTLGETIAEHNHHDCSCSYDGEKLIPCTRCLQIEIQAKQIHKLIQGVTNCKDKDIDNLKYNILTIGNEKWVKVDEIKKMIEKNS